MKSPSGSKWRILSNTKEGEFEVDDKGLLDEVVLDHWFHLERMDDKTWWMRIGDARVFVTVSDDGSTEITVEREFYDPRSDEQHS